jgi:replicative DNA helicase
MDLTPSFAKGIILFASSVGVAALLRKIVNVGNRISTQAYSQQVLDQDYIDEFLSRGIVVIRGVLNEQEVKDCRDGLHKYLLARGVSCALYNYSHIDVQLFMYVLG